MRRFYLWIRDLHLYFGLFVSPFVLLFSVSVFFLVHPSVPEVSRPSASRTAGDLSLPADLDRRNVREQISALRPVLDALGVHGEINFIRRFPKERRLVVPVIVPGRETTVELHLETRSAVITEREDGMWDALVYLHKMPGQHNAAMRGNWIYMRIWRYLADATVYLVLFLSMSGIYLWAALRAERRVGLALLAAGAFSFFGVVLALSH